MKINSNTKFKPPDTPIMQALRDHVQKTAYAPIGFPENIPNKKKSKKQAL